MIYTQYMEFSEQNYGAQHKKELSNHDQKLDEIVKTQQWHDLCPNHQSSDALLPKDLTGEHIKKIASSIATKEVLNATPGQRIAVSEKHIDLGDGLTLDVVGGGESKVCYALTDNEGKKMAVLLQGYQEDLGINIPDDPKLAKVSEDMKYELYEYSDLRKYLSYPVDRTSAIVLQEYGESADRGQKVRKNYRIANMEEYMVKHKAKKYLKKRGFTYDEVEMRHKRHMLFTESGPALIDIPATRIKIENR